MKAGESRYMFAIMPPQALAEAIHEMRKEFAAKYNCKSALKPPVHITLYRPFVVPDGLENRVAGLHGWSKRQGAFDIELRNFGYFDTPQSPVLYIDVVKNSSLNTLHLNFQQVLKRFKPDVTIMQGYTPHITLGYRDVPRASFPDIREEYDHRQFEASFTLDSIFLWKHDTRKWNIIDEYKFGLKTPVNKAVQATLF